MSIITAAKVRLPQESEGRARTTKATILDTALKMASKDGIEGLTIGELAKAVGMSKSGIFAHFGGKDQLQLEVLKIATSHFVAKVLKPAFKGPRGEGRIKQMIKNWLDHLNDETTLPGVSVLIAASTELDDRPGDLRDFVQKAQKDLIANIEKAARIAIEEGDFRRDLDVEQFAWTLYSFVLGYHHFKRMLEDPKAELHLKRSLKGLLEFSKEQNSREQNSREQNSREQGSREQNSREQSVRASTTRVQATRVLKKKKLKP